MDVFYTLFLDRFVIICSPLGGAWGDPCIICNTLQGFSQFGRFWALLIIFEMLNRKFLTRMA